MPGNPPVILEAIELFRLAGMAENVDAGEVEPWALTHTNEREHCQLWALHQHCPREPLASDLLARLREPWLPSPTHWVPWVQGVAGREVEMPP